MASQVVLSGKEPACQRKGCKRSRLDPWVQKIPYRRKWQPIPLSLPGESHGQRSLVGYSPWGHKELNMTEVISIQVFDNFMVYKWCFQINSFP